jgi:ATP-binding cassette, subfamily B, bacterial
MKFFKPLSYHFSSVDIHKVPKSIGEFLAYAIGKSPVTIPVFFLLDVIHFIRVPLSIIILGVMVDLFTSQLPARHLSPEIIFWMMVMAVILVLGEGAHIVSGWIETHWRAAFKVSVRQDFFHYTMGHSYAHLTEHFAGSLTRKITEISEASLRLLDACRSSIGFSLVHLVSVMILSGFAVPSFGLFVFFYILAVTLPVVFLRRSISSKSKSYSDARAKITGTIVDSLTNLMAYKSFVRQDYELKIHNDLSDIETRKWQKLYRMIVYVGILRRAAIVVMIVGGTLLALHYYINGVVTLGQFSQLVMFCFTMIGASWIFGMGFMQAYDELGYIEDALRITSRPHDIQDHSQAKNLSVTSGAIEWRKVSFSYEKTDVFEELSLTIPASQKVALVGSSGAGKSTFVTLMMRLFEPRGGAILIDGQDIKEVTQKSLRAHIGFIPQDTSLFHRSLMENIRYGRLDATDDEVIQAARLAQAHDFISRLSDGYHTLVGERGVKLSGGQRQRIAIARALLKNAPILLLDEATSALDSESELLIQESLKQAFAGKTVIAIAHRLSTIAHMDRILLFDRGRIVEDGSHAELLSLQGRYAHLWQMQSGGFLPDENEDLRQADIPYQSTYS